MAISLLDRAIYSYADVDRLVGVYSGTARRWLEGYSRKGHFYAPVLRSEPTGSDVVTWGEMVEARLLAEFRNRVPMYRMRPAIVELRREFGLYPLAYARPFLDVEGRELVRKVQDSVGLERGLQLVVVRSGQLMLTDAAQRFGGAVEYDKKGAAMLLRPQPVTPDVVMDPQRAFGQPAIRNVRTDTIAEEYRAGTSREELADLYDLTAGQVDEAIRFELIAGSERAA
jgi:uncharacterized protein (DUF433 family)